MRWLLWKDYRHNRPVLIGGSLALLLPYLIALCIIWWGKAHHSPLNWQEAVLVACVHSSFLSGITVVVFGGNAIAGERVDRSAEFLFALPASRKKLLASKLLLALSAASVFWLANLALLRGLLLAVPSVFSTGAFRAVPDILATLAMAELTAFCVSWLMTSFIDSPTFAVLAGLLTPVVSLWAVGLFAYLLDPAAIEAFFRFWWRFWWTVTCLVVSPLCFAIGTWHYLRRVEP